MSFRNYPPVGNYVLCRFPETHASDQPGIKFRPALIIGYGPEYGHAEDVVVLAYSTTKFKNDFAHRMVNVRDKAIGLNMPEDPAQGCYIDCGIVAALPISRDYFSNFKTIGSLPDETFNYIRNAIKQFCPNPITSALYLDPVYGDHGFYDDTQVITPYFAVEQSDPNAFHPLTRRDLLRKPKPDGDPSP
jgi:hypothetical protein